MKRITALLLSMAIMLSSVSPVAYATDDTEPVGDVPLRPVVETVTETEDVLPRDGIPEEERETPAVPEENMQADRPEETITESEEADETEIAEDNSLQFDRGKIEPGYNPYAYPGHDEYYTTEAQQAELEAKINEIIASMDFTGKTTYTKIKMIYDYICDNVVYDYTNLEDDTYDLKYTAYAALINGTAVCNGYALAMCRLLDKIGVENEFVGGTGGGGGHAWNIVKIGDKWYCLDSTWDAENRLTHGYRYFLKTEATFGDHQRDLLDYGGSEWDKNHPMATTDYTPAENEIFVRTEGKIGDNATYTLYDNGKLVISGSGATYDYEERTSPLYRYRYLIKNIIIEDGITHIGSYLAYNNYPVLNEGDEGLYSVQLPDSVKSIGKYAFCRTSDKCIINMPANLESIGEYAFYGTCLGDVVQLSENIKTLEFLCFYGSEFKKLILPEGMEALADNILAHSPFETVVIPKTITNIRPFAFYGCENLINISVDRANPYYSTVNGMLFDKAGKTLEIMPFGLSGAVEIPQVTETIGYYSVANNEKLTALYIHENVKKIEQLAMLDCPNIKDIYYAGTQTRWDKISGIKDTSNNVLSHVTMHYSAGQLEEKFTIEILPCENGALTLDKTTAVAGDVITVTATPNDGYILKAVYVDDRELTGNTFTVTTNHKVSAVFEKIPTYTISVEQTEGGTVSLSRTEAYLDDVITITATPQTGYVLDNIYLDDAVLTSDKFIVSGNHIVTARFVPGGKCGANAYWKLDDSVLTVYGSGAIYDYGYNNTPGWKQYKDVITEIVVEEGITATGSHCFKELIKVEKVSLPDSLEKIAEYSLDWLTSLEKIELPANVKEIGDMAFFFNYNLKEITLPENLEKIGWSAFGSCYALEKLILPDSLTDISNFAFEGCYELKEVKLPVNIKVIKDHMFSRCSGLETITIPKGVTEIQDYTFMGCTSLKDVYLPSTIEKLGEYLFRQTDITQNIHYNGSKDDWRKIEIGDHNEEIEKANKFFALAVEISTDNTEREINFYGKTTDVIDINIKATANSNTEIAVKSTDENILTVEKAAEENKYIVTVHNSGNAQIVFDSVHYDDISLTVDYNIVKMAEDVDVEISANRNETGEIILTPKVALSPKIRWIGGEKWPEYSFAIEGEGVKFTDKNGETNGKITGVSSGSGVLKFTAVNEYGDKIEKEIPYRVYSEKVSAVVLNSTKVVLDPAKNVTEFIIVANAKNSDAAMNEFDFAKSANDNYILEKLSPNTAKITILNGTAGNVTVTATARDGSKKTAKCTISNGIVTEAIELKANTDTLAKGKTVKITAAVSPANATVKNIVWTTSDPTVATVSGGTVKAVGTGTAVITATTTDGQNISASVEFTVVNPANKVVLNNGINKITLPISAEAVTVDIPRSVVDADGETDGISQDVKWTIGGKNAKNVVDNGNGSFTVSKAGRFTITAATTDGTSKKVTVNCDIQQTVTELQINPPKNTAWFTNPDGIDVWVIKEGSTVTPAVKYLPSNAHKNYKSYKIDTSGNDKLLLNAKATNVKPLEKGEYTINIISGDVSQQIILKVIAKNRVDLTDIDFTLPTNIKSFDGVSAGTQPQLTAKLNNSKVPSTVTASWEIRQISGSGTALVSAKGKLDLRNSRQGDVYNITLTLTDKNNPENSRTVDKTIKLTAKPVKTDINLVTDDGIPAAGLIFTPADKPTDVKLQVTEGALADYTVKTSSAKILDITETADGWQLIPTGVGTATLTLTANDGSGVKQTVKVKVGSVANPVKIIKASGTSFYMDPDTAIAVNYSLTGAKSGQITYPEIKWTVSDSSTVKFENGSGEFVTTDTDGILQLWTQGKTGKVTVTGSALDGSKKTVKITVNVANGNMAKRITLRTPANTANGGEKGTALLTWGKSLQLYTGYIPSANKNKTVTYTVTQAPGVTVKNGKLSVVKQSKTLTPYTGEVTVTATLNYLIYSGGEFVPITAQQKVYIQQPVTKLALYNGILPAKKVTIDRGETKQLKLKVYYGNDSPVKYDDILWSSNNNLYGSVDTEGNITVRNTAPKGKTFKITAAAQDGSGKKRTVTIKIG